MAYDEKCFELAEHFLKDVIGVTRADKENLANELQCACEEASAALEDRKVPPVIPMRPVCIQCGREMSIAGEMCGSCESDNDVQDLMDRDRG